jgi:hypothetical protein
MSFATDKWFQHIREELITEGLADIGLTPPIVEAIRAEMPTASEKGRMWVGAAFKYYAVFGEVRRSFVSNVLDLIKDGGFREEDTEVRKYELVQNFANSVYYGLISDVFKARNRFFKKAQKIIPDRMDFAEKLVELVDETVMGALQDFTSRIENTVITLNQNPNNYQMIKDIPPSDYSVAEEECRKFQHEQEDSDQIIYTFQDGAFWYNLNTDQCDIEAARMGHCGGDNRGTLFSLRKRDKGKKFSKSYVTVAYNPEIKTIFQIKGRANSCPPPVLWKYIEKFIEITGAENLQEIGEYSRDAESFMQLANHLKNSTGISIPDEEQMEQFGLLIGEAESNWMDTSEYSDQVWYNGYEVYDTEDIDGQDRPAWLASINSIVVEVPFEITARQVSATREGGRLYNKVIDIFKSNDRNGFFAKPWSEYPEIFLVKARSYEEAMRKHSNMGRSDVKAKWLTGANNYLLMGDLNDTIQGFIGHSFDNFSIEGFYSFLDSIDEMVSDLEKSVGEIQKLLASEIPEEPNSDTAVAVNEAKANPLDVRLYQIDFVMSFPLQKGYEMTDIHNIIRAIPDVTTVRTVGNTKRTQANRSLSLQRLKFALRGQKNRMEWVRKVLIPQIRKISSDIRIHKVERADLVSSGKKRLSEYYAAFSQRQSGPRTTPAPSIQGLIDDWVEGGVMYDQPTNMNLTRYSVMMPVADLEGLLGRMPRKHGHHFDAGYEKFIENGPRDPIYIAIGKNGRAKITGNEDDLRYAIKAGVEEVPVFISYQRQV